MTDYTKLVKALRERAQRENEWHEHGGDIIKAAAAAIEALQAENADIREELFISQRKYDEFTTIASMQNAMLAKQLPKLGEWVREMNVYDEPFYHCSACGECFDSNRDDTYGIFNYCPNCGAKMNGEQNVE